MKIVEKQLAELFHDNRFPLISIIELTNKCNLKCVHCYFEDSHDSENLSINQYSIVLKQLKQLGCNTIVLSGGEPFLRADIFEIIELVLSNNFVLSIFSNATLLDNNKILRLSKYKNIEIQISIYGINETHDKITGVNGSFAKTFSAIKSLKENGIKVKAKSVVLNSNYQTIKALVDLMKEIDIEFIHEPVLAPKRDKSQIYKGILKGRKLINYCIYSIKNNQEWTKSFHKKIIINTDNKQNIPLCAAGASMLNLRANGDITPCVSVDYVAGNVFNQKISDIWNGIRMLEFHKKFMITPSQCFSCKFNQKCSWCIGHLIKNKDFKYGDLQYCELMEIFEKVKNNCDE